MPISITGQLKVSTLQSRFLKEFGLTLRIYDGRSFADPDQTLAQVRKKKGSGNDLAVAKNMKVGNLEDKFEAEFGLKVQVAGSDDSYLCDNDLTLNQAQLEDEKKIERKDRKSAKKASKADDVEQSTDGSDADFHESEDSEEDEVDGDGAMEVQITDEEGSEYIYWVDLEKMPEEEDEYDWSIELALHYHAKTVGTKVDVDDEDATFASEPFSRSPDEFVWVNR